LSGQPKNTLEGELIGQAITRAIAASGIRRLEDGPFGGSQIRLGETAVGEALVRALSETHHEEARRAFERHSESRFLPFDQIDEDEARAELDRTLLVDVLGLDSALCEVGGPMERLRRKLATEPQIHANKRSSLVFGWRDKHSKR
jgi:hypothetical protein